MKPKIKNKKQSFLEGAMVLVLATALVKVLGAIFKIPLGNLIGELGMGYFQTAYDLYLPVYSIALAGMPVAVCRMVASNMAKERYRDARVVLKTARIAFLVIGLAGTGVVLLLSYPYLRIIGTNMGALPGILVIAPSILFCCIMSTYRGYYEGMCNMTPTAVSQVIEAMGKLFLGLGLAVLVKMLGMNEAFQSAAAITGIMLGTLFGSLYLTLRYKLSGDGITNEQLTTCKIEPNSSKQTLKALLIIAVPVIIGSLASQIAGLIDVMTVQRRLATVVNEDPEYFKSIFPDMWNSLENDPDIKTKADLLSSIPTYLYGCYKGFAFSIYSLIPTITSVLGVSALPAMTTAFAAGNRKEVKKTFESVIRITSLISMPAGFGIAALSGGILNLLYPAKPIGAAISTDSLTILGIAVIFGGLTMPMTNLLQAIGKERIPVINMLIGALIKIVLNFILVVQADLNIAGAAFGTLACYVFIFAMDLYFLCKHTGLIPNIMASFFKPLFSAALCGLAAWASNGLLSRFLPQRISTLAAIICACAVYILAIFLLRVITENDVLMLPKGQKIAMFLKRHKWIA